MPASRTLRINRAPVLTLWASVVAERLGMPRDTALTVGHTLAGITAHAKGVRVGIYAPSEERPREARPPLPKGVKKIREVALLGRLIHVADTPEGPRAISKGELAKPESVERYLQGKFGSALEVVRTEMERLAASFDPKELDHEGFHLYEQFRPEVPPDERGLGGKGRPRHREDPRLGPMIDRKVVVVGFLTGVLNEMAAHGFRTTLLQAPLAPRGDGPGSNRSRAA